jgi:hypothetical protein
VSSHTRQSRASLKGGPYMRRAGVKCTMEDDEYAGLGVFHHIHVAAVFVHSQDPFVLTFRVTSQGQEDGMRS